MKDDPLVRQFTALVTSWNAEGWGEYLLWEGLEGTRARPFGPFGPPFTPEQLEMCRKLRDELQVWPYWDVPAATWDTVSIKSWRLHAATTKADDIRARMDYR